MTTVLAVLVTVLYVLFVVWIGSKAVKEITACFNRLHDQVWKVVRLSAPTLLHLITDQIIPLPRYFRRWNNLN